MISPDPHTIQLRELRTYHKVSQAIHTIMDTYAAPEDAEGSQEHEDEIIAELLPDQFGIYIDIGCNDPCGLNNTIKLYRRGWRGILVEPLISTFPRILRERPGDLLFPVAASDKNGFAFLRVHGPLSSLDETWKIIPKEEVLVETCTVPEIMRHFPTYSNMARCSGRIGLCSIDVEGSEGKVLAGIDWNAFKPKVLCIESARYNGADLETESIEWEPIVLSNGYELYKSTRYNRIYIRSEFRVHSDENVSSQSVVAAAAPQLPEALEE